MSQTQEGGCQVAVLVPPTPFQGLRPPPATPLPALDLGDSQKKRKTWGREGQLCRDQAWSTRGNSPQANLPAARSPLKVRVR